jgi:hypothetical protein
LWSPPGSVLWPLYVRAPYSFFPHPIAQSVVLLAPGVVLLLLVSPAFVSTWRSNRPTAFSCPDYLSDAPWWSSFFVSSWALAWLYLASPPLGPTVEPAHPHPAWSRAVSLCQTILLLHWLVRPLLSFRVHLIVSSTLLPRDELKELVFLLTPQSLAYSVR